jgi:hypothetical protein
VEAVVGFPVLTVVVGWPVLVVHCVVVLTVV